MYRWAGGDQAAFVRLCLCICVYEQWCNDEFRTGVKFT
jgi:hypothetical protein